MNAYDIIIYNDDPAPEIDKITVRIHCKNKEDARAKGEKIAAFCLPLANTAVHVEFRSDAKRKCVPQEYWLDGVVTRTCKEAMRYAESTWPAVARPNSFNNSWSIFLLSETRFHAQQLPFPLTKEELERLDRQRK